MSFYRKKKQKKWVILCEAVTSHVWFYFTFGEKWYNLS